MRHGNLNSANKTAITVASFRQQMTTTIEDDSPYYQLSTVTFFWNNTYEVLPADMASGSLLTIGFD